MNTITQDGSYARQPSWFARFEAWLDDKGKGAWIAAMVLGFIFFWPVGLALLMYMIWSKRMFSGTSCAKRRSRSFSMPTRNTGNAASELVPPTARLWTSTKSGKASSSLPPLVVVEAAGEGYRDETRL